jgi:hypothetical protein
MAGCAAGQGAARHDGNATAEPATLEALRADYDAAAAQVRLGPQSPDAFWIAHDSAERCDLAVESLARRVELDRETIKTSDGPMTLSQVHERCVAMVDTMESWRFDVCGTRRLVMDQSRVGRRAWAEPTFALEDGYQPVECSKLPKRRVPGPLAKLEKRIVKQCGGGSVVLAVLPGDSGSIWAAAEGSAHRSAQAVCVARGNIQLASRHVQ